MASLKLVRIDDRLIHGQIITKWLHSSRSNTIVIVDDELVNDEFLSSVFLLAKPDGIDVEIKSAEQAAKEWKETKLGSGNILMLFKTVEQVKKAVGFGLEIKELQVGGIAAKQGKKRVFSTISLSQEEVSDLIDLSNRGIKIYFQMVPEAASTDLDSIVKQEFS